MFCIAYCVLCSFAAFAVFSPFHGTSKISVRSHFAHLAARLYTLDSMQAGCCGEAWLRRALRSLSLLSLVREREIQRERER